MYIYIYITIFPSYPHDISMKFPSSHGFLGAGPREHRGPSGPGGPGTSTGHGSVPNGSHVATWAERSQGTHRTEPGSYVIYQVWPFCIWVGGNFFFLNVIDKG